MSFDLVLFGGTGDLAGRKIIPSLFQAFKHGTLPSDGKIFGVGRHHLSDQDYRDLIKNKLSDIEFPHRPTAEEFSRFGSILHFIQLDLSQSSHYLVLKNVLAQRLSNTVVIYLATAPNLFEPICEHLATAGLNTSNTRIVLEKPLGNNLASNISINKSVCKFFNENQIFRIDHYLGKPSVQNLLALRFGNIFFEPLWRKEYIANIQISITEELGISKRGAFYDSTGALRDMVQNHVLQLLCIIAMEPPIDAQSNSIRESKLEVLRSLKSWETKTLKGDVNRGQYSPGIVGGEHVSGYTQEHGVSFDSHTETFVALRTEICNERWEGVPFYIRTGKRMRSRSAQIIVTFKPIPHNIFFAPPGLTNKLIINLHQDDGLELHLLGNSQSTSLGALCLEATELHLDFLKRFDTDRVGAYERLLLDVIHGDLSLFVSSDEQEEAWRWVEPILNFWHQHHTPLLLYEAGTMGPSESQLMIERDGFFWDAN